MKKYFTNFFHIFIDNIKKIFFQKNCPYCLKKNQIDNSGNNYFCVSCKNDITYISPIKHKNKNIILYALGQYQGILKYIINQKYSKNNLPFLFLKEKIDFILEKFSLSYDLIIPIPKTTTNFIKQGFNPNEILASFFLTPEKSLFPWVFFRSTKKDQAEKKISERIRDTENVFFIPEHKMKLLIGKKILIIDDVYTTGNTLDSLIKILPSSVEKISLFVIARK